MANSTSYKYSKNGQLEKTTTGDQSTSIDRPEESLIKEGNKFKIASVNPIISSGNQSLEIEEENGQVHKMSNQEQSGVALKKDQHQNIRQVAYSKNETTENTILFDYDDDGNLLKKTNVTLGKSETYTYENGLKTSFVDMEGRKFFWNYDDKGNLISESVNTAETILVSHEYYPNGLKKSKSSGGIVTSYVNDNFGNVIEERVGSNEEYLVHRVDRDPAGNVLKSIEGDNLRSKDFLYDHNNKIISVKETRGETTISHDKQNEEQQITDPLGRITHIFVKDEDTFLGLRNPRGESWQVGYDENNRISWKKRPDGNTIRYTYDPKGLHVREITEEGVNQRKSCENKNLLYAKNKHAHCQFKYNLAAQHIGYDITFEGKDPVEIRYDVDATGIRKSLSANTRRITQNVRNEKGEFLHFEKEDLTFGDDILYAYDDRVRLASVSSGSFSVQFTYGKNGGIEEITRGNQVHSHLKYTAFGHLNQVQTLLGTNPVSRLDLAYDTGGNIISKTIDGISKWEYGYDGDDQLSSVDAPHEKRTFVYDKVGNCTQIKGKSLRTFQYDDDRMQLEKCDLWEYHYDLNGHLSEKVSRQSPGVMHSYSYSSLGQLLEFRKTDASGKEIAIANYRYDALGRRIEKKVDYLDQPEKSSHLFFVYDGDNLLLEYTEDLSYWRKYIYLNQVDSLLGFIENGKPYYYLRDNQGSVTHIINELGEVEVQYTYDCFGNLLAENSQATAPQNRYRFSSREWDEESDTYFFRNRTYDPHTGRFVQPDPYPGDPERPITIFNKYVFAANNPLKYTDPYGLFLFTILVFTILFLAAVVVATVAAVVVGAVLGLVYGLTMGLTYGMLAAFTGGNFGEAFVDTFKKVSTDIFNGTVRGVLGVFGVVSGVILGTLGYFVGGIIGLFDGGNWKKGAERGWDIGYNTGFYISNYLGELAINVVDTILQYEVEYPYFYRLSNLMIYFSRLAFKADLNGVQSNLPMGMTCDYFFANGTTSTEGFIAEHSDFIVLAFRGTDPFDAGYTIGHFVKEWLLINIGGSLLRQNWYSSTFPHYDQVAFGFYEAYDSVRNEIHGRIKNLLDISHRPVFVTGHSKGGALAAMGALDLAEMFGVEVYCYTQGAARCGNEAFASKFNSKVFNSQVIQHKLDIVTELPPNSLGYYHVDRERVVGPTWEGNHWPMVHYIRSIFNESPDNGGLDFLPSNAHIDTYQNTGETLPVNSRNSITPVTLAELLGVVL